jgi:predicted transcriptional regulator
VCKGGYYLVITGSGSGWFVRLMTRFANMATFAEYQIEVCTTGQVWTARRQNNLAQVSSTLLLFSGEALHGALDRNRHKWSLLLIRLYTRRG